MRATGAPGPGGGDDEPEASPWGGGVPCVLCEALGGTAEGWCDRGGTFGFRESIFKISHTKSELFFHFPDTRSDVAREPLQRARVVYEGGGQRASRAVEARGCGASHRRLPLPGIRPSGSPPEATGLWRWVHPQATGPLAWEPAWGGCPGKPGHLSRRSYRCAFHPIQTAPLLRSSLRSAGGSAASSASLPPTPPKAQARRRGGRLQ